MEITAVYNKVFIFFRRRRMHAFYAMFHPNTCTRLLDIGGSRRTWLVESTGNAQFSVTLVNIRFYNEPADPRFTDLEADAIHLPLADLSFDIAFSNSAIEHMTTWERQQQFAAEARRVAKKLWIQTPARSFPIEPHLLAPFVQFLPKAVQARIARYFTLWGLLARPDAAQIEEMICDIRLLTHREMKLLFPDCRIFKERFLGLTKSYIAVRGCDADAATR